MCLRTVLSLTMPTHVRPNWKLSIGWRAFFTSRQSSSLAQHWKNYPATVPAFGPSLG